MPDPIATNPAAPRLQVEDAGGIVTLRFPRRSVDGIAVREMLEAAAALTDRRDLKVLVDFTGVPLVSSGAMGMLVTIRKKLMHVGGQLHVVVPDAQVAETFRVTRLHLLLNLFDSLDAARARFK